MSNHIKAHKLSIYYEICHSVAKLSPDAETQVGALLVNKTTGAIMCVSYNGFVRGAPDHDLPRHRPDKYEFIQHAEQNMLTSALLNGVRIANCVVICTLSPCSRCIRMLYQAGITEVYFENKYRDFDTVADCRDMNITCEPLDNRFYLKIRA